MDHSSDTSLLGILCFISVSIIVIGPCDLYIHVICMLKCEQIIEVFTARDPRARAVNTVLPRRKACSN